MLVPSVLVRIVRVSRASLLSSVLLNHFIGGADTGSIRLLGRVAAILHLWVELLRQYRGVRIGERSTVTGSGRCTTAGR